MIFLFVRFFSSHILLPMEREKRQSKREEKREKVFAVSWPHTICQNKKHPTRKNTNNNTSPPTRKTQHTHTHVTKQQKQICMGQQKVRPCDMYVKLCVCCFQFFFGCSGRCVCENIQHSELKLRFEMQKQVAPFTPNFDFCP